jgi:hypothetical protein
VNQKVQKNGENITCQPSPVALNQNLLTIPWTLESNGTRSEEYEEFYVSPGMFQWKIHALTGKGGILSEFKTRTGFLYSAETLNCTVSPGGASEILS